MIDGSEKLTKTETQEVHGRLCNWGRWLRHDIRGVRGYPTQAPFIFSPSRGGMIAELDAEEIEFTVSSFSMLRDLQPNGELYAFVLRVYYGWRNTTETPPISVLSEDVSRRFNRRCGRTMFYRHLDNARIAVHYWSGAVK